MDHFKHAPVNAHIVHKEHDDDVLVSNFRPELPIYISQDTLQADGLTQDERRLLARHYVEMGRDEKACGLPGGVLVRPSVPATLPKVLAEEEGFGFVRQYYQEGGTHLVLNARYMCEEHEVVLMNRLVESRHQIGPYDRYQIGRVTDRMACPERSSRYYMNMINDLKNYFFYRKHHEHVPGIMLIEVARQAVYAQYYRTSPNKRGEVTLTIRHLNCNFEGYIESNYPVVISVETVTEDDDPALDGQECRVARFFQNGRQLASVQIVGMPIKMKTFRRLRIVKPDPNHWFVPVKAFANSALFFDETGNRVEGKLRRFSLGRMEILLDRKFSPDVELDFVLSVDGIGYVDGKVRVTDVVEDGKSICSRMTISELSSEAERRWLEAIKNFSHVECVAGAH